MRVDSRGSAVKYFFIAMLLVCFAALALMIVVSGARVYDAVLDTSGHNSALRTSLTYVAGKVRAGDRRDCVNVADESGVSVLSITSELGGQSYNTYIYCVNGELKEYYASADKPFDPLAGESIQAVDGVTFDSDGQVVTITADHDGAQYSLDIMLRAFGED